MACSSSALDCFLQNGKVYDFWLVKNLAQIKYCMLTYFYVNMLKIHDIHTSESPVHSCAYGSCKKGMTNAGLRLLSALGFSVSQCPHSWQSSDDKSAGVGTLGRGPWRVRQLEFSINAQHCYTSIFNVVLDVPKYMPKFYILMSWFDWFYRISALQSAGTVCCNLQFWFLGSGKKQIHDGRKLKQGI